MKSTAAAYAVAPRRFPLSGGQLESLIRLCDGSKSPMVVVDDHSRDVYRNEAAGLSDASSLEHAFELVDHRDRVVGRILTRT